VALARTGDHLPTAGDLANFDADAPVRLIERALRQARTALEAALARPGVEVAVTENPPPRAYFQVQGDRLWVRVVLVEEGRRQISEREIAALWAAVFGTANLSLDYPPDGGAWDSIYLVSPCPTLDEWPPPRRLDPS